MQSEQIRNRLALYLITHSPTGSISDHLSVVDAGLSGGATAIQLRMKGMAHKEMLTVAKRSSELILALEDVEKRPMLIVNDFPEIAAEVGADGFHLGKTDIGERDIDEYKKSGMVFGMSADSEYCLRNAVRANPDYIGLGPIFKTQTKLNAPDALGVGIIRLARSITKIPIVAIGGIDEDNAEEVFKNGGDGIAVISVVYDSSDRSKTVRKLADKVKVMTQKHSWKH